MKKDNTQTQAQPKVSAAELMGKVTGIDETVTRVAENVDALVANQGKAASAKTSGTSFLFVLFALIGGFLIAANYVPTINAGLSAMAWTWVSVIFGALVAVVAATIKANPCVKVVSVIISLAPTAIMLITPLF